MFTETWARIILYCDRVGVNVCSYTHTLARSIFLTVDVNIIHDSYVSLWVWITSTVRHAEEWENKIKFNTLMNTSRWKFYEDSDIGLKRSSSSLNRLSFLVNSYSIQTRNPFNLNRVTALHRWFLYTRPEYSLSFESLKSIKFVDSTAVFVVVVVCCWTFHSFCSHI